MIELLVAVGIVTTAVLAVTLVLDIRSSRRMADIERVERLALRRLLET